MWLLSLCNHCSRSSTSENLKVLSLQGLSRLRGALLHISHSHWLYKMSGGYLEMWLQTMENPNIKQICVIVTQMADISIYFFSPIDSVQVLCLCPLWWNLQKEAARAVSEPVVFLIQCSSQHFEACKAVPWTQQGPFSGLARTVSKFSSGELECLFSIRISVRGLRTIIAFKATQRL